MARLAPQCAGIRRWGAAALDLAYVAAGRYEGYWERGIHPWDIAAGILIVKEAGGFVEAMDTDQNPMEAGSILASNTAVFPKFQKIIRED